MTYIFGILKVKRGKAYSYFSGSIFTVLFHSNPPTHVSKWILTFPLVIFQRLGVLVVAVMGGGGATN